MIRSLACLILLLPRLVLAQVTIVPTTSAGRLDNLAAAELASYLGRMYPDEAFVVAANAKPGASITFTRREGEPESYTISGSRTALRIESTDGRGTLFAVYALLEKLGCGFYLSYETVPAPRHGRPDFAGCSMTDRPVFHDRIVFDWHNFLSSASSWELEDWKKYIDHAMRMRFNDLMVHAYGNNPIFTFEFKGITKPIGYLATTRAGRDWGTQHVNDVRRMVEGGIFAGPVFGSSIAQVAPDMRAAAAREFMQQVFKYASDRGMGITFALDADTASANSQEMIARLPTHARIASGKFQLANPDTPEGYAFYKAQTAKLLSDYPQITRLAVWFRESGTPWREMKLQDFPQEWKSKFRGEPEDSSMFAIGKLVAAFGRALKETGHGKVALASGSWKLGFLRSADRYLPPEAALMPLDWSTVFDTASGQRALRLVRSGRKLVPIVWAHHDDRTYVGRPYTPYVNFTSLLRSAGGSGFGIIHWTTRPLDLYFKSTVTQVWTATENQPLETACEQMAERSFGVSAREPGRDYLFSFVTEGPMFGRETTDRFIDIPLADVPGHIHRSRERLKLLDRIDDTALTDQGRAHLNYFRDYEAFIQAFFSTHSAFERAQQATRNGDFARARNELGHANPEQVIQAYVRAARNGDMTIGEKALVISLNLRWLPYIVSLRQAAGLEPVRIRIGKVEEEALAQGAGRNTFYFDELGRLWRVLEPPADARELQAGAIMGDPLEPGDYTVNGGKPVAPHSGQVTVPLKTGVSEIVITRTCPPK